MLGGDNGGHNCAGDASSSSAVWCTCGQQRGCWVDRADLVLSLSQQLSRFFQQQVKSPDDDWRAAAEVGDVRWDTYSCHGNKLEQHEAARAGRLKKRESMSKEFSTVFHCLTWSISIDWTDWLTKLVLSVLLTRNRYCQKCVAIERENDACPFRLAQIPSPINGLLTFFTHTTQLHCKLTVRTSRPTKIPKLVWVKWYHLQADNPREPIRISPRSQISSCERSKLRKRSNDWGNHRQINQTSRPTRRLRLA